jgi:two-component system response regulator MprA
MLKILVVDDDPQIRESVKRLLSYEGYGVSEAADYRQAFDVMERNPPDLVILDLMLPGMGGVEIARVIRERSDVPILMLTAKDTLEDKVEGLDSGADDYVVKPFEADELTARVRALMRRRQPPSEVLRFGSLTLDGAARQAWVGDSALDLSSKEFDLLELLMRHPRQVITRETFYDRIWGYDFSGESNILEVYIRYLRAKLEAVDAPRYIQTVRGIGYVLREDTGAQQPSVTR